MTETQTGYFERNGGSLYFEVAGAGEPLVFIHGFTLDTRMWDDQWDVFAQRYRVIRYDVRGFGRSSDPAGPFANYQDLEALLDYLGATKPHVVGLSMGGQIASDYAVTYPQGLSSLVLIDPALTGFTWSSAYRPGVLGLREIARKEGLSRAIDVWLNNALFAPAHENACADRLKEIVSDYRGARWLGEAEETFPNPPTAQRLDSIGVPVLTLVGEHDLPDFHAIADYVAAHAPNARKIVVEGAGHMSNMEAPDQVNRLILDFLAQSD